MPSLTALAKLNALINNLRGDAKDTLHYDVKSQSFNPGLQYPHLHGPVHTPDNNRWDTPPV